VPHLIHECDAIPPFERRCRLAPSSILLIWTMKMSSRTIGGSQCDYSWLFVAHTEGTTPNFDEQIPHLEIPQFHPEPKIAKRGRNRAKVGRDNPI